MLKADTKRITWFLGLRRLLHLPRYFMAPRTIRRQSKRAVTLQLNALQRGIPLMRNELVRLGRFHTFPKVVISSVHRPVFPVDVFGAKTIRDNASGDESKSRTGVSFWRMISRSGHIAKLHQTSDRNTAGSTILTKKFARSPEGRRLVIVSGNLSYSAGTSMSVAPFDIRMGEPNTQKTRSYRNFPRIVAEANEVSIAPPPFRSGSQPMSNSDSIGGTRAPSCRPSTAADDNQSPRKRPAIATLHIDGSTLGRWTVQHLERALGKPATGMTGVDPRATIPRSRVAPF